MKTKASVDEALARLSRAIDRPWDNGSLPSYADQHHPMTRFFNRWTKPSGAFTGTLPAYPTEDPDHPPHTHQPLRTTLNSLRRTPDNLSTDESSTLRAASGSFSRASDNLSADERSALGAASGSSRRASDNLSADERSALGAASGSSRRASDNLSADAPSALRAAQGPFRRASDYLSSDRPSAPNEVLAASASLSSHAGQPDLPESTPSPSRRTPAGPGSAMPPYAEPDLPAPHTPTRTDHYQPIDPALTEPDLDPDDLDPDSVLDPEPPQRRRRRLSRAAAVIAVAVGALLAGLIALPSTPEAPAAAPPTAALPVDQPKTAVTVDIQGKVKSPGVRELPTGSRVIDAITASGGPLPGTDTSTLNLARRLIDGEQIHVGVTPPAVADPAKPPLTNLNTAQVYQLDALPGVGIVTAQRIVEYRNAHGGFTEISQLRQIEGIGPARYDKLKDLVTVS
ncbi:ComEA family DNA-binding protein [Actinokineospora fastidiosa]|nr:ComEA family DNA-binding protein [Actinokineospora fastidiosa]